MYVKECCIKFVNVLCTCIHAQLYYCSAGNTTCIITTRTYKCDIVTLFCTVMSFY